MVFERKTKIIATLGPKSQSQADIVELIKAGANIFRINCSHATKDLATELLQNVRSASAFCNSIDVGVMFDLPGAKIRLSDVSDGSTNLETGGVIRVKAGLETGNQDCLYIKSLENLDFVKPGDRICIDDGKVMLSVKNIHSRVELEAQVDQGGEVKSGKGVDFPDSPVPVSDLTDRDWDYLDLACELGVDFVALSFVRSSQTVRLVRDYISRRGRDIWIISKIERKEALENLDQIIEASDGIMVARGDLALSIPPERLPIVQIKIIEKANDKSVPVIVATQMLLSMVKNRIPTRAEVSDISYSVIQGADAVMLSEETSVGDHPQLAVEMMDRIAREALTVFNFDQYKLRLSTLGQHDIVEAVCYAAAAASFKLNSKAIVACTTSGYSVKLIAKYRPKPPVLAHTHSESVCRRLSLCWGVKPLLASKKSTNDREERDEAFEVAKRFLGLKSGDTVILTGGLKTFQIGGTSLMEIRKVD